jgi:hypothetical protein
MQIDDARLPESTRLPVAFMLHGCNCMKADQDNTLDLTTLDNLDLDRLDDVVGGMRPASDGGGGGLGPMFKDNPLNLPSANEFRCRTWRTWQPLNSVGVTHDGTPVIVPTLHCPRLLVRKPR